MELFKRYIEILNETEKYPTISDLVYKYNFTHEEVKEILDKKNNSKLFRKLELKNTDSSFVHYYNSLEILNKYSGSEDLLANSEIDELGDYHDLELKNGFIFSEIESSLAIEGVRSTRAKIEKISKMSYDSLISKNDVIVKNMILAYEFVQDKDITKDHIFELYNILSRNGLSEDEKLLKGNYYRHDKVDIIGYNEIVVDHGVDYKLLGKLVDDLVSFIHLKRDNEMHIIVPHIIHFYMIYLHPYFDYNGRIARVLSYWYSIRFIPSFSLLFMNEAINNKRNKRLYYTAITNSRKTNNDITYFLEFMGDIILEYTKVYINYYSILNELKGNGVELNRSVKVALKYVLSMPKYGDGYFDWKDYKDFTHDDFSKVQYLKLLNQLSDLKILQVKTVKKAKLFKLKESKLRIL